MPVMAPPRPLRPQERVDLPADPRAAAEARRRIRAAVSRGDVPAGVDVDTALLLTSELVTNAVTHGSDRAGSGVMLLIVGDGGALRVEAHDTALASPVVHGLPADTGEHGRGMLLIDLMASEWGTYRTAVGKAVYFTLKAGDLEGARAPL